MTKKGWIALDIDGTITLDKYSVPGEVIAFLGQLARGGWKIAMATGRSLSFGSMVLKDFDFPYSFLVQNGSAAFEMPGAIPLFTHYMTESRLPAIEAAYEGISSDFLIYSGYEKKDFCYYRPDRFSADEMQYLTRLQKMQKEEWLAMEHFHPEEIGSFPMVKCFGSSDQMKTVAGRLRETGLFNVPQIRDPFSESAELLLVTDRSASKGLALTELRRLKGKGSVVIAAGDDENDLSLFDVADVKIAMAHAPSSLHERADVLAPPTAELGILRALKMALHDYQL